MRALFTIAAFGAIAATATVVRWQLGRLLNRELPWGTFFVNTLGSFLMGVAVARGWENIGLIGGAALGSFTTFSTFAAEAVTQWSTADGRRTAVTYVGSTIVFGVVAAVVGLQF